MNKVNQEHEDHLPNDPDQKDSTPLEEQIHSLLTEGEMETEEKDEAVRRRVIPRTEIRIQTTMDPIVEETLKFRSMAREVDNRYDRYMERANTGKSDQD
ncbi:hypothetical protein [Paenibacillus sp. 1001270B_150601_E10]|uniref:hypothetical protein n=1 Tax=Paenibacillus sp. 1001270B_150601_E10 TaxID=2787079 RepID=UPI001E61A13C|nr:hypothetical protein [Paenibacillus sp. 1001270B_150601_E10]